MKECSRCKQIKPFEDYYRRSVVECSTRKQKLQSNCKECMKEAKRRFRSDPKKWARELKQRREWRKRNPEIAKQQDRNRLLKGKFGITEAEYERRVIEQKGLCAICGQPEKAVLSGKVKNLAVDHCHETDTVRGLLCCSCNRGIGMFRDNSDLLLAAADYLQRHNGYKTPKHNWKRGRA
jgi:hypothetical protein